VRYRCTVCPNNCQIPGKHRGTKVRHYTCICGGALGKGTNADGETVTAVPLPLEQRRVADDRLGLKRSTSVPRVRGAARLELVVFLAFFSPLLLGALVWGGVVLYRRWKDEVQLRTICGTCGNLVEDGAEPTILGRCLACRYAKRIGLA
jgi:hypothetical protein